MASLRCVGNNEVKLLPSSKNYDWNTTFEKCNNNYDEGEIFTLGKARYANIKYWKGKYISSGNMCFTSIDNNKVLTKYVYYILKKNIDDGTADFYKIGQQYPQFSMKKFNNFKIPIISIDKQIKMIKEYDDKYKQSN